MENFLFVDLSGLTPGKAFAGFAAGDFVDMNGRAVTFKAAALKTFIGNTLKAIEAAQKKGMPGLPIDARQHDKGDAAGWIVDAAAGEVEDSDGKAVPVIMLAAEWTKVGLELLRDKVMTNFSPTVDLVRKVIRGGSLTNWPASVDGNGAPLFPAVELAEGMYRLAQEESIDAVGGETYRVAYAEGEDGVADEDELGEAAAGQAGDVDDVKDEVMDMTKEEMAALVAAQVKEAVAAEFQQMARPAPAGGEAGKDAPEFDVLQFLEMSEATDDVVDAFKKQMLEQYELMKRRAGVEAAEMIARIRRESDIKEFVQLSVGGSADVPYGLPVDARDLEEFLSHLQPSDLEFAKKMLASFQTHGRQKFNELGHGKQSQGGAQLPTVYAQQLDRGELTVADLSAPELGLGDVAQYDLSKWGGK